MELTCLAFTLDLKEEMRCSSAVTSSLLCPKSKEHFLRCLHLYRRSCQPFADHNWCLWYFLTHSVLHLNLYRLAFSKLRIRSVQTTITWRKTMYPSFLLWSATLSSLHYLASLILVSTSLWRKLVRALRRSSLSIILMSHTRAQMLSIWPKGCRKGSVRQLW